MPAQHLATLVVASEDYSAPRALDLAEVPGFASPTVSALSSNGWRLQAAERVDLYVHFADLRDPAAEEAAGFELRIDELARDGAAMPDIGEHVIELPTAGVATIATVRLTSSRGGVLAFAEIADRSGELANRWAARVLEEASDRQSEAFPLGHGYIRGPSFVFADDACLGRVVVSTQQAIGSPPTESQLFQVEDATRHAVRHMKP